MYSGIIFSFGANGENVPLGLTDLNDNMKFSSVKLAREIVYWYNNHPSFEQYRLDLTNVKNLTIIGNGNVAIDIARIFLRKPNELALT
jgi:adrenodoxin-NADP+ reductase